MPSGLPKLLDICLIAKGYCSSKRLTNCIVVRSVKALPKQRFRNFVDMMIGMVDIRERLDMERQMEEMKEMLVARRKGSSTELTAQLTH
jgi:hypothetical protein